MMAAVSTNMSASHSIIGIQSLGDVHVAGHVIVQGPPPQNQEELAQFSLPRSIKTFRGRDEELKELESLFFEQNVKKVVISGLPGMGKSELAKQFAERYKKDGKVEHVFWIKAENKEDLEKSGKLLKSFYQNLNKYKCLYLFDNAVSRQSIFELEPPDEDNMHMLITSQAKDWGTDVESLKLDHLTPESAIEVYRVILNDSYNEQDSALYSEMAAIVNYIPLGLQVTAAYVRQRIKSNGQHFRLQDYVDEMKQSNVEYIDKKIPVSVPNPYTKSLYGAIKTSVNKLKSEEDLQLRQLALNALFICAFLKPEDITLDDLLHMSNIADLLPQHKKDKNSLRTALTLIDNFCFISYDPNNDEIKLHRLIQEILRHYLRECDPDIQSMCYNACLEALFNLYTSKDTTIFFRYQYSIILKYADDNFTTFYNFYLEHKNKLFLKNVDAYVLDSILKALIKWNCIESLKVLLSSGNTNLSKFQLLHKSVRLNNMDVMKLLVSEYNSDVHSRDEMQRTPLHYAAWLWNVEAVKYLLENSANLNDRDWIGETPLFFFLRGAQIHQQFNIEEANHLLTLLKCTDNIHITIDSGETLLHTASGLCNVDLVTLLITKYKLDVNAQSRSQYTPLHSLIDNKLAKRRSSEEIKTLQVLKTFGARLDITDWQGRTPYQLAQEKEKTSYLAPYLIHPETAT